MRTSKRRRRTNKERRRMIQLSFKYGNSADVSRNWRMSTRRPLKRTIEDTVNRVLDTGTVGDRKQTGRPAINFDIACSNVDLDVKKYPQSSQRDRARRLGLSQSMILRKVYENFIIMPINYVKPYFSHYLIKNIVLHFVLR